MDAIAIDALCFSYPGGASPLMQNLSLRIPGGAATAVLGPNGSGKTTLLHLFLGLLAPVSGRIAILGKAQSAYAGQGLKQLIGLVPQSETIPFDLSVLEYVLLGRAPFLGLLRRPGPADVEVAVSAIETVGMSRFIDRAVPSLSSGERQLVAIARTLTQQPAILMLDEPIAHLDLANGRRVLALIRRIAAEGRTVVFTTHDPNAASAIADQVVLFGRHGLVAQGCPGDTLVPASLEAAYGQAVEVFPSPRGPLVMTW